jgi:streptogramin lyase
MKRLLLIVMMLACAVAHAQSTLSGRVANPDGSGFNGRLVFSLAMNASASAVSPCTGPTLVVPTEQITVMVTAGNLVSPPTLTSSVCTIPVGVPYNVIAIDSNGNVVFTDQWLISGNPFNVGTAVSSGNAPTVSYKGLWGSTTTYTVGDIVGYGVTPNMYVSVASNNVGNVPGVSTNWQELTGGGGGSSGFPIMLGSTVIGSGSTTAAVTGLSVNGVMLSATGVGTSYLDQTGNYSTPAGTSLVSFAAPSGSWPAWLVPTVTNSTTTPSLTVAASAIPNAALAYSALTVSTAGAASGGGSISLGGSLTITVGAGGIASVIQDQTGCSTVGYVWTPATNTCTVPGAAPITSITATAPVVATPSGSTVNVSMPVATTSVDGYLSSTDWTTFNGKQAALTNPVTGPGSGATVGHLAVMGNTSGTSITDGGAVPVTIAAVSHQYLTGYSAITGAFTKAQPTLADIAAGSAVAGTFNFNVSTLYLPSSAGNYTIANGGIAYDTTNNNWHIYANSNDNLLATFNAATPPTSGHLAEFQKAGNAWNLIDGGAYPTIPYPGANTLGVANLGNTGWRTPLYSDITALFGSGSCSGLLKSDGTCPLASTLNVNSALDVQCSLSDGCQNDNVWNSPWTAGGFSLATGYPLGASDTTMTVVTNSSAPTSGHVVTTHAEEIGFTFNHTSGGNSIYDITRSHHGTPASAVSVGQGNMAGIVSEVSACTTCGVYQQWGGNGSSIGVYNPGLTASFYASSVSINAGAPITSSGPGGALGTAINHAATDFEPALGNPGANGYVLSSTTGGTRSWIAPTSGGGTVTTSGSPVSPNIAAFSSSTAITAATSANIQTAIGAGVYDASGAAAARQANLSLLSGTYTNGDMCTYASTGTLLNCNTAIPSVGSWGALNYPTWASGTPFVKMTAAGTFALDTNTYLTSSGISGMTAGQVPIAATATTITSSKALAGSGAGITTGPTSSTSGDLMSLTGTGGQAADSGIAASNVMIIPIAGATLGTYSVGSGPQFAAVDASGNVWVANYGSANVTKLSSAGATLGTYSVGSSPIGVAVDASGNVWVANNASANVTKLSSAGATLGTYSVESNPYSVAVDASGNVWVADAGSNNVTKLSSAGATLGTYSVGSSPFGVAVDASGNVWVANNASANVTKLSSAGATLGTYSVGSYPLGVAVDASGNVWVADAGSNNVTKLSSAGATLGTYSVGSNPFGVAVDASGNVWVANYASANVTKLSSAGATLGTYSVGSSPIGVAVDASGNVWVANNGSANVTMLSSGYAIGNRTPLVVNISPQTCLADGTGGGVCGAGLAHSDYAHVEGTLFATNTMLGPVFAEPLQVHFKTIIVRLSGTISCTGAPVVSMMDLGTSPSTAFGSAIGSVAAVTTGTSDGVYQYSVSVNMTPGDYYGFAFTGGTCVTAPTFDITAQVQ